MKKRYALFIGLSFLPIFCFADVTTSKPGENTPKTTASELTSANPPITPAPIDCQYKLVKEANTVEQTLLSTWAKNAAIQSFQFNPENLNTELEALKKCYTEQGWKAFNEALKTSGNLDAIRNNQLTVTSQASGTPDVQNVKEMQWKVSIPLKVTYENKEKQLIQTLKVNLLIALNKKSGSLGIMQIIAVPQEPTDKN